MEYKLGKSPVRIDARTLRFGTYLTAALPQAPASVAYQAKVPTWPMYDNDKYGDCTAAAAGHLIQSWTANASTEVTPADATVLHFYKHFVETPPPPDEGCNMLDVLHWWRHHGVGKHRIMNYSTLDLRNHAQAKDAIWLFGGAYLGVSLPDFAVAQGKDWLTIPWEVPHGGLHGTAAPNPANGHCIPAVGYDAKHLYIVTWGALKPMSWAFYDAYAEESYAILSHDFLGPDGTAPAGFDLATLQADLLDVADVPAADLVGAH